MKFYCIVQDELTHPILTQNISEVVNYNTNVCTCVYNR